MVAAAAALVICLRLSADVYGRGDADLLFPTIFNSKQGLDDRSGVRWLIMALRRPGDVVLTTHLGWPAVW